ncbi:hypothetical protein GOV07_03390 [Candidatus Woesearchaeota archaeon]|nr:hypothetical protein [Candidatus Woesearchaeota archaeon]
MKQTLGIIMVMVMTLTLMQAASAALVTSGPSLEANLLYYQPIPAQPGDTIDVWIQVENVGGSQSRPGSVKMLDSYPFSLENEEDREKVFTAIPAQENFLMKTRVRIDKNANEGTNYLSIRIIERDTTNVLERELPITIQGKGSALSIVSVETVPKVITPGSEAIINIELENVGTTLLRNLEVKLDLSAVSLAPSGGSDSITIATRSGNKKGVVPFGVVAYPDAESGTYRIPITLTYEDEQGNEKVQEETIGIQIGSEPELLVYIEQNGLSKDTMSGTVVVKFVNKGLSEIKLLEMEVIENDDVEVLSESSLIYVGNIDEDDYESADIALKISKSPTTLPIRIAYRDALNTPYEEVIELELDATNGNGKHGSSTWMWIVIVVVIGGAFWWWRKRKNAKKSRK